MLDYPAHFAYLVQLLINNIIVKKYFLNLIRNKIMLPLSQIH